MYTRCPKCRTAYRIDPRHLRDDHAEALCERCNTVFDALATLAVVVEDAAAEPVRLLNPPAAEEREPAVLPNLGRQRLEELDRAAVPAGAGIHALLQRQPWFSRENLAWGGGALALLLLLLYQVFGFEREYLAQKTQFRPLLESVCGTFGCTLPPFRDIEHLRIMDRTLNMAATPKAGFEFSMVFANQSKLPQAFPKLKLVLNELDGKPVAERLFDPIEYLPEWQEGMLMPIGNPFEVRLAIAKPSREIGGFTIEFK